MPILRINEMGQIYQSSPDREDGLGYGSSPECVSEGDLTLGAAYLKANQARTNSLIRSRRSSEKMDHLETLRERQVRQMRINEARRQNMRNEVVLDPRVQQAAFKKAMGSACTCDYKQPLTGNVMTANGLSGWDGMNRDQQTIHNAVLGMGRNTAFMVDPQEKRQAQMRKDADRLLRLKARR